MDIFFHPVCINVSASSDNFALLYKDSTDLRFVLNVYKIFITFYQIKLKEKPQNRPVFKTSERRNVS